jgi:ParB-like chromosome segregation protein Spo0J
MATLEQHIPGLEEAQEILNSRNIDYEYREIQLSEIDLNRSLMSNAREDGGGFNPYWVETYALAYQNGEQLPPIICMRAAGGSTKKPLVVLSGHHRVAAALQAGLKSLPGFVVDTLSEPNRLYVITESNRRVGYGWSEEQRIESALRHVSLGESIVQAARMVGIDEGKVQRKLAHMRADERFQRLTPRWSQLSSHSRMRLNAVQSDEVAKPTFDLAVAAKLSSDEVSDLVRDINKAKTDQKRMEVVASNWELYQHRVITGDKKAPKSMSQSAHLGKLRASLVRLGTPEAWQLIDEVLLSKDVVETLAAAEKFIAEAVKRAKRRSNARS